jgi:hypothetical protein
MAVKTFTTGEVLTAADTNTYLANSGLVYVTSQTIGSAVGSVTVSNCFSSTYDNYKIMIQGGSASSTLTMRFQLGASTTTYYDALIYVQTNATTTVKATGSDGTNGYWDNCGIADSTRGMYLFMEIQNPNVATYTTAQCQYAYAFGSDGYVGTNTCVHATATAYTGFTVALSSGTMTGGTITVYGYRKA